MKLPCRRRPEYPLRSGERLLHRVTCGKAVSEKRRSAVRYDPSPVHYNSPVGYREKLFKAVLGGYDGHAEIAVQPAHGVDKVLCGYRV